MSAARAFGRADGATRRLAIEAVLLLGRAALAIRARPFPETIGFGMVALGPRVPVDVAQLSRIVVAVARRMPFRALCFEQGLAVQRLLRRRGRPAMLHYGVEPGEPLRAHVWISLDGAIVHGGETAGQFTEVGRWG